jgi:hypothetical protein
MEDSKRAMTAVAVATVTAPQVVILGENHQAVIEIKID